MTPYHHTYSFFTWNTQLPLLRQKNLTETGQALKHPEKVRFSRTYSSPTTYFFLQKPQRQNVSLLRRFSMTSIPAPVKKLTQANSKSFSPLIQKSSISPSLSMSWECIAPTVLVNILECPSSRTGETKELSTSSSIKSKQSSLPGRLDPYP